MAQQPLVQIHLTFDAKADGLALEGDGVSCDGSEVVVP